MSDAIELAVWEDRPIEYWRDTWGVPELLAFEVVASTNDVARGLAEAGAPAGTTVLAERQTAGRGRAGRRWYAPSGTALLLSVVLRPLDAGTRDAAPGGIPLRVGLAVARAAEALIGQPLGLKWPNDVVAPGIGKVAGVLCEGSVAAPHAFVVAGIGVNVNQRAEDFPPDVRASAASLAAVVGRAISRAELVEAIIDELRAAAGRDAAPLDPDELERIARRDVLRGRVVAVDGTPRGTAVGIAPDGALRVRGADGRVAAVHTGTVRIFERTSSGPRESYP